jgi:hypothetical protein
MLNFADHPPEDGTLGTNSVSRAPRSAGDFFLGA